MNVRGDPGAPCVDRGSEIPPDEQGRCHGLTGYRPCGLRYVLSLEGQAHPRCLSIEEVHPQSRCPALPREAGGVHGSHPCEQGRLVAPSCSWLDAARLERRTAEEVLAELDESVCGRLPTHQRHVEKNRWLAQYLTAGAIYSPPHAGGRRGEPKIRVGGARIEILDQSEAAGLGVETPGH